MKRRKPLRRIGAVTRRYLAAREAFLHARWLTAAPTTGDYRAAACACGDGQCTERVLLWWDPLARRLKTNGHVHHNLKRSTHPGLREDHENLLLVSTECHQRLHWTPYRITYKITGIK